VSVAEDPGDHAERRGDREGVHHDRLHRQDQRPERDEEQHEHHQDDDRAHPGEVRADGVDQVDGLRAQASHQRATALDVDLSQVPDECLRPLGLVAARPGHADQHVVAVLRDRARRGTAT
jgi:hypothetical protein